MKEKATKQTAMDILLKRMTPPQEEPQAGPAGGVFEEGLVIIGDDSFMQVATPETLQWDTVRRWETVTSTILTLCRPRLMCVCILGFNNKKLIKFI